MIRLMRSGIKTLLFAAIATLATWQCTSEEMPVQEKSGHYTCRLEWSDDIMGFEGNATRATVREKKDGDCVFLRLRVGGNYVVGKAVYNAQAEEWMLTYDGSLTLGVQSSCQAYFFEGIKADHKGATIPITHLMLVSSDNAASYVKENNCVKLQARLRPETGRIRFKGPAKRTFTLKGLSYLSAFDLNNFSLTTRQEDQDIWLASDGMTAYVYAIPTEQRQMSVYYDFLTFRTACASPILDKGLSGYMQFPSQEAHNGWSLTELVLATVSDITLSALSDVSVRLSAEVSSAGNGTISESGFLYSPTIFPRIGQGDSQKITCGTATKLDATMSGLKPKTLYYARAYAINERGTQYGNVKSFVTAGTPTVPAVRTGTVTNTTSNSFTIASVLESLGETNQVSQHGIVWNTTPGPTLSNSHTQLGANSKKGGTFHNTISGLQPNTTYYVRAYATNNIGTAYGEELAVTTQYAPVRITTNAATAITSKTANITCSITDKGGHNITNRGLCWSSDTSVPTTNESSATSQSATDSYTIQLSGLKDNTVYYARAFARTANGGVYYGSTITFTTARKEVDIEFDDYDDEESWD